MHPCDIAVPGDGIIGATLWQASQARALVLIHPATAVTQGFYAAFADYLHSRGFSVITYDYRGTGRSRGGSLRDCDVSMADWMELDVGAVTAWAAARFPGLSLLAVGHSVGGHAIALASGTVLLRAGVLVACHAGVTATIQAPRERLRVWCVMRLLAPLLCALFGYMPGRRLGLGEDLPAAVMLQWSRWSRLPHYFYDDPAMHAKARAATVAIPLLALGLDDDPWANPHAMDLLLAPLINAAIERRQCHPDAHPIGHMGFFRKRSAALWPAVADWLCMQADVHAGAA